MTEKMPDIPFDIALEVMMATLEELEGRRLTGAERDTTLIGFARDIKAECDRQHQSYPKNVAWVLMADMIRESARKNNEDLAYAPLDDIIEILQENAGKWTKEAPRHDH